MTGAPDPSLDRPAVRPAVVAIDSYPEVIRGQVTFELDARAWAT